MESCKYEAVIRSRFYHNNHTLSLSFPVLPRYISFIIFCVTKHCSTENNIPQFETVIPFYPSPITRAICIVMFSLLSDWQFVYAAFNHVSNLREYAPLNPPALVPPVTEPSNVTKVKYLLRHIRDFSILQAVIEEDPLFFRK